MKISSLSLYTCNDNKVMPNFGAGIDNKDLTRLSREENLIISDAIRTILTKNDKGKIFDKNMKLSELHKKITDLFILNRYIEKNTLLRDINESFDTFLEMFIETSKYKLNFDYSLNAKKDAIDRLNNLALNKNTENIFKKIGIFVLQDIIVFNNNPLKTIPKSSIDNFSQMLSDPKFSPLIKVIDDENLYKFLQENKYNSRIAKNLEVIKIFLGQPEYSILNNIGWDINIIKYQGNTQKLLQKLKNEAEKLNNKERMAFYIDPTTGNFHIAIKKKVQKKICLKRIEYFDKNLNIRSKMYSILGQNLELKKTINSKIIDLENNAVYLIRKIYNNKTKNWLFDSIIRIKKNSFNQIIEKEIIKKSNIGGVFNIKIIDRNGNITTKSFATKDNGGIKIYKRLVSQEGVRTIFDYNKTADGKNENFDYIIKDKTGTLLGRQNITVKYTSRYSSVHNINGKTYKIRYSPSAIKILDKDAQKITVINLTKLLDEKSQALKRTLKQLPATELLALHKRIETLSKIKNYDSCYSVFLKQILSGSDVFVFLHELGHAKNELIGNLDKIINENNFKPDFLMHSIEKDRAFQKIFNEEKKSFFEKYPKYITNITRYFTGSTLFVGKYKILNETIAEINAIIHTPKFADWLAARSHYLQENFPRTVAYLMKKL